MKKPHKFLMPLTALTAVFATHDAIANEAPQTSIAITDNLNIAQATKFKELKNQKDAVFNFVLKKDSAGNQYAYHESHYSHESHQSHQSHHSHYSGS